MKYLILFLLLAFRLNAQAVHERAFMIEDPVVMEQSSHVNYRGPDSLGVYTFVETQPEFPGGEDSLFIFIKKSLQYPKAQRDSGVGAAVIVRFIINEDGSVSNIKVARSGNASFNKEAVRVTSILPKFIPGRQNGKPVKVYFNMPVIFKKA